MTDIGPLRLHRLMLSPAMINQASAYTPGTGRYQPWTARIINLLRLRPPSPAGRLRPAVAITERWARPHAVAEFVRQPETD
jgi:hypothetical protein